MIVAENIDDVKPPAKRPRLTNGVLKSEENEESAPVTINFDAMVNVMEFLPPRSLFNVAMTCKSLREKVTTKMVVQSALIHGGNAETTMDELYKLMKNHSIHVPSPLRLLRLANGKRCEFCIFGSPKYVRRLGVFACYQCLLKRTEPLKTSWQNKPLSPTILGHPRVVWTKNGCTDLIWNEHCSDKSGERIGSLATWRDVVDGMDNCYARLKAANDVKEAAVTSTDTADTAAAASEEAAPSLSNGEWIDYYLTNTLNAPSKEAYAEFTKTYTDTTERVTRIAREKKERKDSKLLELKQAKILKVKKMLDDLTALIDEPFRQCAMKSHENEDYLKHCKTTEQCVFMETPFINNWLVSYIKSPSKMTKKVRKEMAEKINVKLRSIEGLLEITFLSDDDDVDATAKKYFRECFPNVEALFQAIERVGWQHRMSNKMDENFLKLIESDRSFEALCHLRHRIRGSYLNNVYDLSPMLLVTEPSASLVRAARDSLERAVGDLGEAWLNTLAEIAWGERKHEDLFVAKEYSRVTDALAEGHKVLSSELTKIDAFVVWLESKGVDEDTRSSCLKRSFTSERELTYFTKEVNFDNIWEHMRIMHELDVRWQQIIGPGLARRSFS